jgi:hypothetical protein
MYSMHCTDRQTDIVMYKTAIAARNHIDFGMQTHKGAKNIHEKADTGPWDFTQFTNVIS